MFRFAISAVRIIRPLTVPFNAAKNICYNPRSYTTINTVPVLCNTVLKQNSLLNNKQILDNISNNLAAVPTRTVTKFSLKRGKRKTVKAVVRRFLRLDWGCWIRTKVGKQKRMWKKNPAQRRRLKQHVFCNSTQSTMLDKMVTKFWKRPKHYVEDPYAPYHTREEFSYTRKKPFVAN